VEIGTLRYNGPALKGRRNTTSPYGGIHTGAWPIALDLGDVTRAYFQDPKTKQWHELRWEHADALDGPLSREAFQYARRLAVKAQRFPDVKRTLIELLERWGAGLTGNRTERRMALRLSGERLRIMGPESGSEAEGEQLSVDQLPSVRQLTAMNNNHPPESEPEASEASGDPLPAADGDDDEDDELDAAFPAERGTMSDEEYYAGAWEVS
jgi:hypothetical protein